MSNVPLEAQIACLILTFLFFCAFSIAREPRGWRRLFQSTFSKSGELSVNRNKVIDESLKTYGIVIAMVLLVADVSLFVWGLTYAERVKAANMTPEERDKLSEFHKNLGGSGAEAARRSVGQ
jgi:hypothetical protein